MQNILNPKIYDALLQIMSIYPDKFSEKEKIEIEILLEHCLVDIQDDSEKFLTALIIKALKTLVGEPVYQEHDFLGKYEIAQIDLFNVLVNKFPFVKWSHDIANKAISQQLKDASEAVIVDIGIGQGIQIESLLKILDTTNNLEKVIVVGIEPFKDALDMAKQKLEAMGPELSFQLEVVCCNAFIQEMDLAGLNDIISNYDGEIIINSVLTLHHLPTLNDRLNVISNLRELSPKGIVLVEPNSDHFEPDFNKRFQNCYQHFYHVFQVIDKLDIDKTSKNGLKLFFGREIDDILGKINSERFEKHEPAIRWIEKLIYSGFIVRNNFLNNLPRTNSGIRVEYCDEGYLGFNFKSETILSVIYAEPNTRF